MAASTMSVAKMVASEMAENGMTAFILAKLLMASDIFMALCMYIYSSLQLLICLVVSNLRMWG